MTLLNLALPAISTELKPTSAQLLWIVDIDGFMIAGSLISRGTLGDRIGQRKLLLIGAAALCNSVEMLIATRGLLARAGASLALSTLSLIRNMIIDPRERIVAISMWVTRFSVGAAVGPLPGGVTLAYFRCG